MIQPTAYPDVNALLDELLLSAQTILGKNFVGMYLYGSLVTGDFDRASDIDFLVVADAEISSDPFSSLQEMHARIAASDSHWAKDIEGAYLSRAALRRYNPNARHLQLERGAGRTLAMANHFRVVERAVLRDCGIVVAGAPIQELIDPVSPNELRESMLEVLDEWIVLLLEESAPFHNCGDQSYNVLSLCRVLYTLENGVIASKPAAARWAQEAFGARWHSLIQRALEGRHDPSAPVTPTDTQQTLAFARFTLERSQSFRVR